MATAAEAMPRCKSIWAARPPIEMTEDILEGERPQAGVHKDDSVCRHQPPWCEVFSSSCRVNTAYDTGRAPPALHPIPVRPFASSMAQRGSVA